MCAFSVYSFTVFTTVVDVQILYLIVFGQLKTYKSPLQ